MIIILLVAICFVGAVAAIILTKRGGILNEKPMWAQAWLMASTLCLVFCLASMFGLSMSIMADISEYEATMDTIQLARTNANIDPLENAALQHKVVEINQWMASVKFYRNNPWTSWFVPKSVMSLKPIK